MADLKPLPVNGAITDANGNLTADWVRALKALEAKIKELEARILELETP